MANQVEKAGEYIVLVNEAAEPIGTAPKLASHHLCTPLHKAFSCYIFDEQGRFLVTQRALSKKVWPSVWTNSVCGHPGPGESDEVAIARRTHQELGMTVKGITVVLPTYRYTTPPYDGVIENEICPVYVARLGSTSAPNPDEVEALIWQPWDTYVADIQTNPDKYSYWAKDQLPLLLANDIFTNFIKTK